MIRRLSIALSLVFAIATAPAVHATPVTTAPTHFYFDQTEELDYWNTSMAPYSGLATQHLIPASNLSFPAGVRPAWDTNGQICLSPDGSGKFTSGYNPTAVGQSGPDGSTPNGGIYLPHKQPPVGVAIYNPDGSFTGQDLFVPGPYKLSPASSQWSSYGVVGPDAGGDVPPDSHNGPFNNEGTYTGCAFSPKTHNLFAVDLGTSQGAYPTHDDGRLIEWFADSNYQGVCIIYGPNSEGDVWSSPDAQGFTTHHVDGHGGLQQPGIMAADDKGNIYVPSDGTIQDRQGQLHSNGADFLPDGKVLKFDAHKLPKTEADCPDASPGVANGDQTTYHVVNPSTFIKGDLVGIPFPGAIARDPICKCWAVDNLFFGPFAVEWFNDNGRPIQTTHLPIPANFGLKPDPNNPTSQLSPFGMAFDRNGDLFVVDIHVNVDAVGSIMSGGLQAGPTNGAGQLLEYQFTPLPVVGLEAPSLPITIASGEDYPVSVTACDPTTYENCPQPAAP
ncbi:MAG: hypothetical protein ACYDCC_08530 [Actinomycetota bacterium]